MFPTAGTRLALAITVLSVNAQSPAASIIAGKGTGAPEVHTFSTADGSPHISFSAYNINFGGVRVGATAISNDQVGDIITGELPDRS